MKKATALAALLLLPAFFLLHNYNELFGFIPAKDMLFYALVIYSTLLICYLILRVLKITAQKATLILLFFSFFILFFSSIHETYKLITFNSKLSHYWVLLPLSTLLLLLLSRKIIKAKNISPGIFSFLNLVTLCLFIFEVIVAFQKDAALKKNHNLIYPGKPLYNKYISPDIPDSSKPDIYFFVFDEYTNNNTLKKMWGYDNSDITNWLNGKNFFTPANTRCNYTFTVFSVSSTFNMDYIDKKLGSDGTVGASILKANQSLSDNETFSILKKENYNIHFIAPFKNSIQENGLEHFFDYLGDKQIPSQTLPGNISATIISDLKSTKSFYRRDSLEFKNEIDQKCQSIQKTVDLIKATTDSSVNRRPNFVYGHILVPHVPHIYDSAGNFLTMTESLRTPLFNTYTAQVKYANNLIEEIVSYLQHNNKKNTIIIIEGDHGFRRFTDSLSKYSIPNFYAFYFPDKDYSMIYDSMSPVNTFRILFNKFFHQNFPMLKDSSVIVKDEFY